MAARDKTIKEQNERVAKLEKTVKDMEALLELKSKGMAESAEARQRRHPPAAAPAPPQQAGPCQAGDARAAAPATAVPSTGAGRRADRAEAVRSASDGRIGHAAGTVYPSRSPSRSQPSPPPPPAAEPAWTSSWTSRCISRQAAACWPCSGIPRLSASSRSRRAANSDDRRRGRKKNF